MIFTNNSIERMSLSRTLTIPTKRKIVTTHRAVCSKFSYIELLKFNQFVWLTITDNLFFKCIITIFFDRAIQCFVIAMITYHSIMNVNRLSNVLGDTV